MIHKDLGKQADRQRQSDVEVTSRGFDRGNRGLLRTCIFISVASAQEKRAKPLSYQLR